MMFLKDIAEKGHGECNEIEVTKTKGFFSTKQRFFGGNKVCNRRLVNFLD